MISRAPDNKVSTTISTLWLSIRARKAVTLWEVTRDKIVEVEQIPRDAWPVLSLDERDVRFTVPRPLSNRGARSIVWREVGQPARIINRSRQGVIYGRPNKELPETHDIIPAAILIDAILRDKGWPNEPFAVGFLLSVEGSHNEILALWRGMAKQELSNVEVTENAQQIERIIETFCDKHKIDTDNDDNLKVIPLDEVFDALNRYAASLSQYPTYDDLFGIPVTRVWAGVSLTFACAALVVLCIALTYWYRIRTVDEEYASTLSKSASSRQAVIELFNKNVGRVADRASIDYRGLIAKARQIYSPGGVTSLLSTRNTITIRYTVPVDVISAGASDGLTNQTTPITTFVAARTRTIDGIRPTVSIGAAGNELNYDYKIPTTHRRLLDYLDR